MLSTATMRTVQLTVLVVALCAPLASAARAPEHALLISGPHDGPATAGQWAAALGRHSSTGDASTLTHKHKKGHTAAPECMWLNYTRHDSIRAWELQGQPHRHKIRDREAAIAHIEAIFGKLSRDPSSGVQLVPSSRWQSIFKETAFEVSTRHGHPLHPRDKHEKHSQPFPWKGLAYLRLRQYKLLTPAGAYVPTAMPGAADVTLKMKKIDPDTGLGGMSLPKEVGASKLTAKMEWDGHCDHGRVSMSPLFKPVSQDLNVSRIGNVKEYFPDLSKVSGVPADEPLPFMHQVYRAKVVWTVVFKGVIGEANLVIKYNTTFEDAVAGARPKNGELSLRIRRDVAEATGTTGEEGRQRLWAALDAVGRAMQVFRDHGWDGKTPSLADSGASSDDGGDSDSCCGCDCKHCKGHSGGKHAAAAANTCGCGCKSGCDCKHCESNSNSACKRAAAAHNKCGCGCKRGCDRKHCQSSSNSNSDSKHAAAAHNKCGCGCKCGCDCKHCKGDGDGTSNSNSKHAAAADKCGCGCKCGCDCKHCKGDGDGNSNSNSNSKHAAAADKCGCGCKCGCDCKHCKGDGDGDGDSKHAAAAANKCGCGCKCGCDCKKGSLTALADILRAPLAAQSHLLPRSLRVNAAAGWATQPLPVVV